MLILGELTYHYIMLSFIPDNLTCSEVCSIITIATPTEYWTISVILIYFLHPFTFNFCFPTYKWVYWAQYIIWFCFLLHSDNLWLLIGAFRHWHSKWRLIYLLLLFVAIATDCCSFFCPLPFSAFCGINWAFYMMLVSLFLSMSFILSF